MSIIDDGGHGDILPATVMTDLPTLLGLTPLVRLRAGAYTVEWPARLARISDTVDPATRAVGVIVAVDDPYRQARPGRRPPLAKNMYVEVELRGRPRSGQIVAPLSALRDGKAFVVTRDNRLEIRAVDLRLILGGFAVIKSGLSAGERIVISDLIPAIDGMLLDPSPDAGAEARLIRQAAGEAAF